MRRKLFFALTLLIAVTMQAQTYWNGTSNKVFSGSGTQADPYLISTPEQLAGLAERVNTDHEDFEGKYLKLTADLYLNNFNNTDTASWPQWEPIGNHYFEGIYDQDMHIVYNYFRGHFDGDGHTIYNMYYHGCDGWGDGWDPNDPFFDASAFLADLDRTCWYRGLFGYIGGTIENLTVEDAQLTGLYVSNFAVRLEEGGVVRNCAVRNCEMFSPNQGTNTAFINDNYGLIENCNLEANMSRKYNPNGLVETNYGTIRGCQVNVSSSSFGCYPVAYINNGLIERTHSTVDITATGAHMASGFVLNNSASGLVRECSSSGTVRGWGDAAATAMWTGKIAGFCVINTGVIESSYSTCDMVDLGRADGYTSRYNMAGFVTANGYNGSGIQYDGVPGISINCFAAGSLTFPSIDAGTSLCPFLGQYNGTDGTPSMGYTRRSRQFNCYWTKEGTPEASNLNQYWACEEVTLAQLQSQAFVDTLNKVARFMGTSQWEYRPGQLPRPTGVYIHDKTDFFAQGDGTKDNPYLVSNKTELENLAWLVNKGYDFRNEYLKQTADIELNAPFEQWGEVAPTKWTAIGTTRYMSYFTTGYPLIFDGCYDGDFHEVKNMYINSTAAWQGLFGRVGSGYSRGGEYGLPSENVYVRPSVIRNLGVTDVYIRAGSCGAIAGFAGTTTDFIQCWSSGKIYSVVQNSQIAGLCGVIDRNSHILNCKTSVELYPSNNLGSDELRSFCGESGNSLIDTIVNALYTGVYQSTTQRDNLYAFAHSNYGVYKNVCRDSTLSPQNSGWDGTNLYSTDQMQSKELVNVLNTAVTEWNTAHGEDLQLDYWKWLENDYPRISRDTTGLFCTINFETNGGSAILPLYVIPGSYIEAPARPSKSGYLFHAWYRDAALTDFFDFKRDSITGNTTLYAKWIVDERGDYDLTPFQNEFATTYHIKTAAQLRGLAVAQRGVYDWSSFSFAQNSGSHPTITAPMDFTGKTIVLDNDIFLNDTSDWKLWGNHCYAVPWDPIGQNIPNNSIDISFKGTFDGQGHVIYGMYCEMGPSIAENTDRYDSQWGLFACLGGGTVSNVGVEASVIDLRKHEDAIMPYEAVVSESEQYWINQGSTGWKRYANRAGMLVGKINVGTVEQSYAKGRIIPHEKDPSYADIGDSWLGGLVSNVEGIMGGRTSGSVSNCFARVDIVREKYDDIKGFAILGYGYGKNDYYSDVTFTNCYGAGHTSQGNNIATTYYNKELVTTTATNTSAKSTYEMHTMNTYKNWDFENIWVRNDTVNDGYPVLRIFHPNLQNSPDPVTVTGITLQETTVSVLGGDDIQLHASVIPANAGNQKINWSINNAKYGSVDENGLVHVNYNPNAGGTETAIVTATTDDGGFFKRCTLSIQHPKITIKPLKMRRIGETEWGNTPGTSVNNFYWVYVHEYLVATYTNPVVAHTPVTWTSSNEELLTVEPLADDTTYMDGNTERQGAMAIFRCLATGSATLTATNEQKGYTGKLTRTIKTYAATSLALTPTSATLLVDETLQLKPSTTPSYATTPIEWTSDDPNVVIVSETGLVTAVGAGTATVTATAGSYSATCTLTVESNTFYTIVFVNDDGETELWSTQVRDGETPVYAGPTPTKEPTASTIYTFDSWFPELAPATEDALYMATYTESVRQYTIRFLNWDGEELQSSLEDYGATPAYTGETPEKPEDDTFTYTFSGWSPEIGSVVADADYTAVFDATEKPAPTCDTIVCDFTTKASSHSNYYDSWTYDNMWEVFGGANNSGSWNYVKMGGKSATLANANPVYVVNKNAFDCAIVSVKVTFPAGSLSKDGMTCNDWGVKVYSDLNCTQLLYTVSGGTITGQAQELTIESQEGQPWSAGYAIQVYWNLANTSTTNGIIWVSKIEYIPVEPEPVYYTVTFEDWDGTELKEEQVEHGHAATPPANPVRENYYFMGWDKDFSYITEDLVLTATYKVYDPTGMESATDNSLMVPHKIIRDGQIYILRGDKIYTLTGQEVR